MALTQLDYKNGDDRTTLAVTQTVTAVAGAATTLGGTSNIRILIDDAVALSKNDVMKAIDIIQQRIKHDTWPPTLAINAG